MKTIYLAGGCFWGVQKYFDLIPGVISTTVGYANGHIKNPVYEDVRSQKSGHVETLKVDYDENIILLSQLLDAYFEIIDPFSLNRQGNDIGSSYRTGIYYTDKNDVRIIQETFRLQQAKSAQKIVVEVCPLDSFYSAEEYHQKYLEKNPGGYCHIPKIKYEQIHIQEMSEYEKMCRKELFDPSDAYLRSLRKNTNRILNELNHIDNSLKEKRYELFKELFGRVGKNLNIKSNFHCDNGYNIYFKDDVFVNVECVFCDVGRIYIGNNVLIGPQVGIYAVNHPLDLELRRQGLEYGDDVIIKDNVWIGGHATINPGITLEENVIVASGSVVTKSFESNVMIGGNPARIIKHLK